MYLRTSATVLRAIVGLALGFGFLGFATHSQAPHTVEVAPAAPIELAGLPTAAEL